MRGLSFLFLLTLLAVSCVRPSSREFFVLRENAEYGDTYSFFLDLSDSTATYGVDFFTRLEREGFKSFPEEDIILDLRWFSPSDSIITDTAFVRVGDPSGQTYFTRDIVTGYSGRLELPESGEWRLKARIVNDASAIRGLGLILKRD